MVENTATAYCVKCKTTRPMEGARAVYMANGRPATRGTCPECGAGLFKIGATPEHAALPAPQPAARQAGPSKSASGRSQSTRSPKKAAAPPAALDGERASVPLTDPVEAYCIVCRMKRVMKNGNAVYLANGSAASEGVCPKCGTRLYRLGATKAHEQLPRPVVQLAPTERAKRATHEERSPRERVEHGKAKTSPGPHEPIRTAATGTRQGVDGHKPARGAGSRPGRHGSKLVIVESPAKARTVGRFLGQGYDVRASIGHVRDLLRSKLSVDLENDFAPTYRVPNEKRELVKELKEAAERASEVFLATDPDREGEAIAWHLLEAAEIPTERARRVVFHEITRNAVADAFAHSRGVDMRLVDAQQARRILDRLVGYQISPLLWARVRSRLSAGRVQSVTVRLIVEREREIAAFVPVEYWSIDADLAQVTTRSLEPRPDFVARLVRIRGAEPDLKNRTDVQATVAELEGAAYVVSGVKRGERRRRPNAPFTTSTLQQDAAQRLGMTAQRTMRIAQELYEGIEIGREGTVGLVTYMRTDSVNVAQEAQVEARALIAEHYGPEFLPPEPNVYHSRAKNAQEAHEAVRPTSSRRSPEMLRQWLNRDQYRLYELIWQRFVASQMAAAIYDTLTIDVAAGAPGTSEQPYLFRTSGSKVRFPGFLVVYSGGASSPGTRSETNGGASEGSGQNGAAAGDGDYASEGGERTNGQMEATGREMPIDLAEGEPLDLLELLPEQHFTQPPPRYSEATLVKALEENGIGRPSTYASIISTIIDRGYIERADKKLIPTELGYTVNDLLVKHFDSLFNVTFTSDMEEHLDSIAAGEEQLVPVLRDFYDFFGPQLQEAEQSMEMVRVEPEKIGEACPEDGGELIIKAGRFGKFVGCSNYPTCRYTRPLVTKIGVACPQDGGELVERRTRRGRVFYGCANYPDCDFTSWKRPVREPCPRCGGLLVVANKDSAECTVCHERVPMARLGADEQELASAGAR
jgi:DNA topoisomerase I